MNLLRGHRQLIPNGMILVLVVAVIGIFVALMLR